MQEEIKRPMTLEELMGDVKRHEYTLPDGKVYKLKNSGELTPNQRRDLHETHMRLLTADPDRTMEDEFADKARLTDLMFYDSLPKGMSDDIAIDWVAALLDFFFNRITPEQAITMLRARVTELEALLSGDTSEANSTDSTE